MKLTHICKASNKATFSDSMLGLKITLIIETKKIIPNPNINQAVCTD